VSSQSTVREIKEKVYYYGFERYSLDQQHLFRGSVLLEDDKILQEYMITNGTVLYLVPPGEIPVLVHTLVGICRKSFIAVMQ